MHKYYVTKMDELGASAASKLVEVQFLRRPPTLGLLYAKEESLGPVSGQTAAQQAVSGVALASLSLNSDNRAKFLVTREAQLRSSSQRQVAVDRVVALDTFNQGQLLVECSSASSGSLSAKTREQLMSSSVFALTQSGHLWVVSMANSDAEVDQATPNYCELHIKVGSSSSSSSSNSRHITGENFLQLQVQAPISGSDAPATQPGQLDGNSRIIHVLSKKSYYSCLLTIKPPAVATAPSARAAGEVSATSYRDWLSIKLEYQYSPEMGTDEHQLAGSSVARQSTRTFGSPALVRMLPVEPESLRCVLLELSDGSLRLVKRGRCLWSSSESGERSFNGMIRQNLMLLQVIQSGPQQQQQQQQRDSRHEPTSESILLSMTDSNQLVAHSLSINISEDGKNDKDGESAPAKESNYLMDFDGLPPTGESQRANRDPDRLLPRAPSFELEQCWAIELNELFDPLGGIGSFDAHDDAGDDNDDEDYIHTGTGVSGDGEAGRRLGSSRETCLFAPLWLPDENGDLSDWSSRRWPQFLFVFHRHHVLIFSFEQVDVLPFSVVYDRAFLHLLPGSQFSSPDAGLSPTDTTSAHQDVDKRIDLRARPRLVHNVKLIGTQPSDCLFNLLFLSRAASSNKHKRLHMIHVKHFNQLALMAAITSAGHVLVFKLNSPQVVDARHKDNLYQQVLLESLRAESLLRNEIDRLQDLAGQLKSDASKLEAVLAQSGVEIADAGRLDELAGLTKSKFTSVLLASSRHLLDRAAPGECKISVGLEHHEQVGGLYELAIEWANLIYIVAKVIVISTIDGTEILAPNEARDPDSSDGNNFGAEIAMAPIKRVAVSKNTSGERPAEELFRQGDSVSETTISARKVAAKAVLELVSADDINTEDSEVDDNLTATTMRVQVPMVLRDGPRGHVKVYVMFTERNRARARGISGAQSSVAFENIDGYARQGYQLAHMRSEGTKTKNIDSDTRQHVPLEFITRELPFKPLNSYRLSTAFIDEATTTSGDETAKKASASWPLDSFEASGSFSVDQLALWLSELLDMTWPGRTSERSLSISEELPLLRFRSNLTGCSIDIKLISVSERGHEIKNKVLVASDDTNALELLRKHTLKRATDNSIRLSVNQDKRGARQHVENDHHGANESQQHLADRQLANGKFLDELVRASASRAGIYHIQSCPPLDGSKMTQGGDKFVMTQARKEMLLETVLGELDQLDPDEQNNLFGPEASELIRSTDFLGRSLREDVERLFAKLGTQVH